MRRIPEILWPGLLLGWAIVQAGCQSSPRHWVPPEDHTVTIVSDAAFVRTARGDYIEGYLAEYEREFQKMRMFVEMEIVPYLKGDRLIVTGRFSGDSVRTSVEGRPLENVRVFEVEKAEPNVPSAPDIPPIK